MAGGDNILSEDFDKPISFYTKNTNVLSILVNNMNNEFSFHNNAPIDSRNNLPNRNQVETLQRTRNDEDSFCEKYKTLIIIIIIVVLIIVVVLIILFTIILKKKI
mgnify:CR=1 FL=1